MKSACQPGVQGHRRQVPRRIHQDQQHFSAGTNFSTSPISARRKLNFYTKLNEATPGSSTPLRGALSKVGQYFAKKRPGQVYDPVQYSCQKNFNICQRTVTGTRQALAAVDLPDDPICMGRTARQLDMVGQQDGTAARPMFDGTTTTVTTAESWSETTTTVVTVDNTPQKRDIVDTTTITHTTPTTWARTDHPCRPRSIRTPTGPIEASPVAVMLRAVARSRVRTTANHNLAVGDQVIISGVTPAAYNSSAMTNGVATVASIVSSTRYTFVLTGLSSQPVDTTTNPNGTTVKDVKQRRLLPGESGRADIHTADRQRHHHVHDQQSLDAHGAPHLRSGSHDDNRRDAVYTHHSQRQWRADRQSRGHARGLDDHCEHGGFYVCPGRNDGPGSVNHDDAGSCRPAFQLDKRDCRDFMCYGSARSRCHADGFRHLRRFTPDVACHHGWQLAPRRRRECDGDRRPQHRQRNRDAQHHRRQRREVPPTPSPTLRCTTTRPTCATPPWEIASGALGAGTNVCNDNVAPKGNDVATWQHMTTYTLGLGLSGLLKYDKNYLTQTSGDYQRPVAGNKGLACPRPEQRSGKH